MALVVTLVLYVPLTVLFALRAADARDRVFVLRCVFAAWLILGPATAYMDMWLPFAGGGDDQDYFNVAHTAVRSQGGFFDPARFVGVMSQPGFPWVLSVLNLITGPDLLAYKLVNLCFLVLIGLTWYRIAFLLEGSQFARRALVAVLALAPLWYYVFFLLKDMAIALLQSVFLLGLVQQWVRGGAAPWLLMGGTTTLLVLFRLPLVLQHAGVALGALLLRAFSRNAGGTRLVPLVLGVMVFFTLASVASDPAVLAALGMRAEAALVSPEDILDLTARQREATFLNRPLFPLIYLFTETAAWSPQMWQRLDASWLRAVLALPWIFLAVPYFVAGLIWLLRAPNPPTRIGGFGRLRRLRLVATPWAAVALFIGSSLVISWSVGETTRWRISDLPAITTVAMAGWAFTVPRVRQEVLLLWVTGATTLFSAYYLMRQF